MQFHQITKNPRHKTPRRIGRGGKRGTYSGRGIKGLGARAGGKFRPEERDIIKKIPKSRGYRFRSFRAQPVVVNLDMIEQRFNEGEAVNPKSLVVKGLVEMTKGRMPKIKILARGEMKKKLTFKDVQFSRGASAKVKS